MPLIVAEEVEEHKAGAGVALLKLRHGGPLGGGLGRGAHTAGRVPGGVGVVTWTHDGQGSEMMRCTLLPLTP